MGKKYLLLLFAFCLLSLLQRALFPSVAIQIFPGLLVFFIYRLELKKLITPLLLLSLFSDLTSSQYRLGAFVLCNTLSLLLLLRIKRHFFYEKLSSLPILSALFSILQTFFLFTFFSNEHFTLNWLLTDLIIYPLADGFTALVLFGFLPRVLRLKRFIDGTSSDSSFHRPK